VVQHLVFDSEFGGFGDVNIISQTVTTFLGAKSTSIRDCVRRSVGPSVGPSPTMRLRGKIVTSRLLREEEDEEETDYVAIPLRRDSFAPRD
jgi:hypothetical protein